MKTRIISALVGTVLLLGILFCPYEWVFVAAAAVLAAIATWELLHKTGIVKSRLFTAVSMSFAAAEVLAIGFAYIAVEVLALPGAYEELWENLWYTRLTWLLPIGFILISLFLLLIRRKKPPFVAGLYGIGMTLYATLGFGSLASFRMDIKPGLVMVLLVLIIAWMSDTGAYFTGVLFGKHKMAPVISPKKTWEGFFGGWAFSVGCAALFGVICNSLHSHMLVDGSKFAIYALPLAPLSVCGDLFASLIKRRCGIKDFSNIMPGHGGVMDRFDSVVLTAPLLYVILLIDYAML